MPCDSSMVILHLAFVIHLRQPQHHALASRYVGEHPGEKVLNQLKRADRLAELLPFLSVGERVFVGAHLASRCLPAHKVTRHPQHPSSVAE